MKSLPLILSVAAAALSLSACNNKSQSSDAGSADAMANDSANHPAVVLPPSIRSTVAYRCSDNSVASVDFLSDDTQVNLRVPKSADPVHLTAPEAGKPWTGNGYTLTGDEKNITIEQPGKGKLTCHV